MPINTNHKRVATAYAEQAAIPYQSAFQQVQTLTALGYPLSVKDETSKAAAMWLLAHFSGNALPSVSAFTGQPVTSTGVQDALVSPDGPSGTGEGEVVPPWEDRFHQSLTSSTQVWEKALREVLPVGLHLTLAGSVVLASSPEEVTVSVWEPVAGILDWTAYGQYVDQVRDALQRQRIHVPALAFAPVEEVDDDGSPVSGTAGNTALRIWSVDQIPLWYAPRGHWGLSAYMQTVVLPAIRTVLDSPSALYVGASRVTRENSRSRMVELRVRSDAGPLAFTPAARQELRDLLGVEYFEVRELVSKSPISGGYSIYFGDARSPEMEFVNPTLISRWYLDQAEEEGKTPAASQARLQHAPGDRVKFAGHRTLWDVKAVTANFTALTQQMPFESKGALRYTVIDWAQELRGACDLIGQGYGDGTYDKAQCAQMLQEFENEVTDEPAAIGALSEDSDSAPNRRRLELSHRNRVPLAIERIDRLAAVK